MFRLPALRTLSLSAGAAAAASATTCHSRQQVLADNSSSSSSSTEPAATCPVAFMWRWTGAIKLPFNHPPVTEVRANFNQQHYPKGLDTNLSYLRVRNMRLFYISQICSVHKYIYIRTQWKLLRRGLQGLRRHVWEWKRNL